MIRHRTHVRRFPTGAVVWAIIGLVPCVLALVAASDVVLSPSARGNYLAGVWLAAPFLLVAFPFLRMARRAGFGARIDPAAIIAGLEAPDDETRVAAAAKLYLLPGPEMHDRAIAHLADPVPAVRLHATRALLSSRTSRQRLYELLAGPAVTEQPARAAALADLGDVMGPTSPYRSWLKTGVLLREPIRGVLTSALVRVATSELALPLLEAAVECQVMPYVHPDHLGTVPYPNMCCVCGAANPTSRMQLRSESTGYGVTTWTIGVPVCAAHRSVSLSMDKGSVLFPKPQVVAALLRTGSWHVTGVNLFAGRSGRSGRQRDERNHAVAQPAAQVAPALAVALPTAPAPTVEPFQPAPSAKESPDEFVRHCVEPQFVEGTETRTWRSDPVFTDVVTPLNTRQYAQAIKAGERILPSYRDLDIVYQWLGSAYRNTSQLERSRDVLREGVARARRKSIVLTGLGETEAQRGDLDQAVYAWSQAVHCLQSTPEEYGAYLFLSYVAGGLGIDNLERALLAKVDEMITGHVRLDSEAVSRLSSLVQSKKMPSMRTALEGLQAKYFGPPGGLGGRLTQVGAVAPVPPVVPPAPLAPAITAAAAPMPVASSIPEQPMAPAIHGSSAVAPARHSRRLGFGIALGGLALLLGVLMLLTPPAPGNTRTTQDTSGIVMICIGALALPIGGFMWQRAGRTSPAMPPKRQLPPQSRAHQQPAPALTVSPNITLHAADQQMVNNLTSDPSFLRGVLMADGGRSVRAFLAAMDEGLVAHEVSRDPAGSGFIVRMTIQKAVPRHALQQVVVVDSTSEEDSWITNKTDRPVTIAGQEMFGSFHFDIRPGETSRIQFDVSANAYELGQYSYDELREIGRREHWEVRDDRGQLSLAMEAGSTAPIESAQSPLATAATPVQVPSGHAQK